MPAASWYREWQQRHAPPRPARRLQGRGGGPTPPLAIRAPSGLVLPASPLRLRGLRARRALTGGVLVAKRRGGSRPFGVPVIGTAVDGQARTPWATAAASSSPRRPARPCSSAVPGPGWRAARPRPRPGLSTTVHLQRLSRLVPRRLPAPAHQQGQIPPSRDGGRPGGELTDSYRHAGLSPHRRRSPFHALQPALSPATAPRRRSTQFDPETAASWNGLSLPRASAWPAGCRRGRVRGRRCRHGSWPTASRASPATLMRPSCATGS